MRVHRIALRNYRGVTASEVRLNPDGVTVIEGPNGVGKSSLAEALYIAFQYPETSTHRAVRALQPNGQDVATEVEVEVETGPYRFTLSKAFNRRTSARLQVTAPQHQSRSGGEAHELANQILDQTHVDRGLLRALWVRQGQELGQVALLECPSLGQALDLAAGSVPAGEFDQSLLDRARHEFARYWTPGGAPGKPLTEAARATSLARQELADAQLREQQLERYVEQSERALRASTDLAEQRVEQQQRVERLRLELAAVQELEAGLERGRLQAAAALAAASLAGGDHQARLAGVESLAAARRSQHSTREALEASEAALVPLRTRYQQAEADLKSAASEREQAEDLLGQRNADERHLKDAAELVRLRERHQRIQLALQDRAEAQSELLHNQLTAATLRQLQKLEAKAREAAVRLEASGATVTFAADQRLEVEAPDGNHSLEPNSAFLYPVTEATAQFTVDGRLRLTVAAGSGADAQRVLARAAQAELGAALKRAGVEDLAQAAQRLEASHEATRRLRRATETITENLRDLDLEGMEQLIATQGAALERHRRERDPSRDLPSGPAQAQLLREEAEGKATLARAAMAAAQARWDAQRTPWEEAQTTHLAATSGARHAQAELERVEAQLAAARALIEDQELAERAEQAGQELQAAQLRLAALEQDLALADPEGVRARHENGAAALRRLESDLASAEEERVRADAQIEVLAPTGLFDLVRARSQSLDAAEAEEARLTRQATAAKTLVDSLDQARLAARHGYLAPLREQIESRGRTVFGPRFAVELDPESLQVSRCRLQEVWLEWDKLSTGTQEQLAIVVRLAAASLASAEGGVPLIIDDALGYADEERLERMCAVLGSAGQGVQIIALTCVPRRYQQIGGALTIRLGAGPLGELGGDGGPEPGG